jgi:hypothetical protein
LIRHGLPGYNEEHEAGKEFFWQLLYIEDFDFQHTLFPYPAK